MESIRVNVSYRPLRIGWVIGRGDFEAFREAVRLSYALWGGRYNPIVVADESEEAVRLVELFRVDALRPVGAAQNLTTFIDRFPHLRADFLRGSLYFEGERGARRQSMVLDVSNTLAYFAERREWEGAKNVAARIYTWTPDDPLADVFLAQFGGFPDTALTGVDYADVFLETASGARVAFDPEQPIPADTFKYPSIPDLCRRGLRRRYVGGAPMGPPGIFVGDGDDLGDLIAFWNLRAADVRLVFIDRRIPERFGAILPWLDQLLLTRGQTGDPRERLAIWSRHDDLSAVEGILSEVQGIRIPVSDSTWNGRNLQAPAMELGETSVLGLVSREEGNPMVSFSLSEKPFSRGNWFHTQHLVASVSFGIGLYREHRFTLAPPFVPELNERCARAMYFGYDRFRMEPGRVGLVVGATDKDVSVRALAVADVADWIFGLAGYGAQPSNAGLIVRQLINGLGSLQGARAFKIPGVRRLVRTHGPTSSFTQNGALQLIGGRDPDTGATFSDHEGLHIEPRTSDRLTPKSVFEYLVDKGVFRMGAELTCPSCRMTSWTALGALKPRIVCDLCGTEHDVTRQLIGAPWHYRRSGIMGTERQAQGAIPVVVTL